MSSGRGVRSHPAAHGHFGRSLQTKKNGGDALAEDAEAGQNGEDALANIFVQVRDRSREPCGPQKTLAFRPESAIQARRGGYGGAVRP